MALVQKNDGRVLRFWAVWDDRSSMYGDRRPYVVHYYLADDTMEVLEAHEMNSGRDPFPVFIARAPMPRTFTQPGFTVSKRVDKRQCLSPADLRIGCAVTLHNRTMLLYACDAFTRQWYMVNLGYTTEELTDMDIREEVRCCCMSCEKSYCCAWEKDHYCTAHPNSSRRTATPCICLAKWRCSCSAAGNLRYCKSAAS